MKERRADGEKLRLLREEEWLTQEELASMAGVTAKTIGEIERGMNPHPRRQTVFALARALEVGPDALMEGGNGSGPKGITKLAARRLGDPKTENLLFGTG